MVWCEMRQKERKDKLKDKINRGRVSYVKLRVKCRLLGLGFSDRVELGKTFIGKVLAVKVLGGGLSVAVRV